MSIKNFSYNTPYIFGIRIGITYFNSSENLEYFISLNLNGQNGNLSLVAYVRSKNGEFPVCGSDKNEPCMSLFALSLNLSCFTILAFALKMKFYGLCISWILYFPIFANKPYYFSRGLAYSKSQTISIM